MNFLLQFTVVHREVRHHIAVELGKLYPNSRFAGIVGSEVKATRKYLNNQKDIKYESLYDPTDAVKKAANEDADYELLREFEETLPEKSLWRIIAVDRKWAWQFVKGVYLPKYGAETTNTYENILKIASGYLKFIKGIFSDFKPDVVIPAAGQNNMMCPIIDQLCKNEGIIYALPEIIRTMNYMAITDNRQCTFPQINKAYKKLKKQLDLERVKEYFIQRFGGINEKCMHSDSVQG